MTHEIYRTLPGLLINEISIVESRGLSKCEISVPEYAHAIVTSAISRSSGKSPLVVVAATNSEAEKLFTDLKSYLGSEKVEFFPSWETLPFERVSPGVETMGKRLRVIHRLMSSEANLEVVVTSVRALVQKLFIQEQTFPIRLKAGDLIDHGELTKKLVLFGYKREYQVEHRGELAIRGSIIDLWPSTSAFPIRIDFWGDEIERLCEFGVADQRSKQPVDEVEAFPCRELILDPEMLKKASFMADQNNWGTEEWKKLAEGELFDGMESFLPWLLNDSVSLGDIIPEEGMLLLLDRKRLRSRVADLLEKENRLIAR